MHQALCRQRVGWASLAFAGALWQLGRTGSRSIAQALHDQEAQPVPALAARSLRRSAPPVLALVACATLGASLVHATTPDPTNLAACRIGLSSCDRSRLTLLEMSELAREARARNLSNCRNGHKPCDQGKLSSGEASLNGRGYCDRSRLTPFEAATIPAEVR